MKKVQPLCEVFRHFSSEVYKQRSSSALLFSVISSGLLLFSVWSSQARRSLQNRRALRPRPQRPLTAMAASTLWTPRPRPASAATAPKCRAQTTQSSSRSSNSKKKSSSKASTCTIHPLVFFLLSANTGSRIPSISCEYCGTTARSVCVCGDPKQVQQETKERDPVSPRARHAGYDAGGSGPVPAPGGEAGLGNVDTGFSSPNTARRGAEL